MKKFILALALCCLMGNSIGPTSNLAANPEAFSKARAIAQGAETEAAKLVVEGPQEAGIGDLVVVSVEKSRAKSFKWSVIPSTNNFLVIEGGKRAVFSSGVAGDFKFVVSCSLGDTCDLAIITVKITESAKVTENLATKIAEWCESVNSDTKRDDVLKLAQAFSSVANVMEGKEVAIEEFIQASYKSNQDALGVKLENWAPFRDKLSQELQTRADAGQLPDTAAHVNLWRAISKALLEYAKTQ